MIRLAVTLCYACPLNLKTMHKGYHCVHIVLSRNGYPIRCGLDNKKHGRETVGLPVYSYSLRGKRNQIKDQVIA